MNYYLHSSFLYCNSVQFTRLLLHMSICLANTGVDVGVGPSIDTGTIMIGGWVIAIVVREIWKYFKYPVNLKCDPIIFPNGPTVYFIYDTLNNMRLDHMLLLFPGSKIFWFQTSPIGVTPITYSTGVAYYHSQNRVSMFQNWIHARVNLVFLYIFFEIYNIKSGHLPIITAFPSHVRIKFYEFEHENTDHLVNL